MFINGHHSQLRGVGLWSQFLNLYVIHSTTAVTLPMSQATLKVSYYIIYSPLHRLYFSSLTIYVTCLGIKYEYAVGRCCHVGVMAYFLPVCCPGTPKTASNPRSQMEMLPLASYKQAIL